MSETVQQSRVVPSPSLSSWPDDSLSGQKERNPVQLKNCFCQQKHWGPALCMSEKPDPVVAPSNKK